MLDFRFYLPAIVPTSTLQITANNIEQVNMATAILMDIGEKKNSSFFQIICIRIINFLTITDNDRAMFSTSTMFSFYNERESRMYK